MTNFEKYKDDLLDLIKGRHLLTIALKDGKLSRCGLVDCVDCEFHRGSCGENLIKWLAEEAEEAKP